MPVDRERCYRRSIVVKALEALEMEVEEPTVLNVDLSKEG